MKNLTLCLLIASSALWATLSLAGRSDSTDPQKLLKYGEICGHSEIQDINGKIHNSVKLDCDSNLTNQVFANSESKVTCQTVNSPDRNTRAPIPAQADPAYPETMPCFSDWECESNWCKPDSSDFENRFISSASSREPLPLGASGTCVPPGSNIMTSIPRLGPDSKLADKSSCTTNDQCLSGICEKTKKKGNICAEVKRCLVCTPTGNVPMLGAPCCGGSAPVARNGSFICETIPLEYTAAYLSDLFGGFDQSVTRTMNLYSTPSLCLFCAHSSDDNFVPGGTTPDGSGSSNSVATDAEIYTETKDKAHALRSEAEMGNIGIFNNLIITVDEKCKLNYSENLHVINQELFFREGFLNLFQFLQLWKAEGNEPKRPEDVFGVHRNLTKAAENIAYLKRYAYFTQVQFNDLAEAYNAYLTVISNCKNAIEQSTTHECTWLNGNSGNSNLAQLFNEQDPIKMQNITAMFSQGHSTFTTNFNNSFNQLMKPLLETPENIERFSSVAWEPLDPTKWTERSSDAQTEIDKISKLSKITLWAVAAIQAQAYENAGPYFHKDFELDNVYSNAGSGSPLKTVNEGKFSKKYNIWMWINGYKVAGQAEGESQLPPIGGWNKADKYKWNAPYEEMRENGWSNEESEENWESNHGQRSSVFGKTSTKCGFNSRQEEAVWHTEEFEEEEDTTGSTFTHKGYSRYCVGTDVGGVGLNEEGREVGGAGAGSGVYIHNLRYITTYPAAALGKQGNFTGAQDLDIRNNLRNNLSAYIAAPYKHSFGRIADSTAETPVAEESKLRTISLNNPFTGAIYDTGDNTNHLSANEADILSKFHNPESNEGLLNAFLKLTSYSDKHLQPADGRSTAILFLALINHDVFTYYDKMAKAYEDHANCIVNLGSGPSPSAGSSSIGPSGIAQPGEITNLQNHASQQNDGTTGTNPDGTNTGFASGSFGSFGGTGAMPSIGGIPLNDMLKNRGSGNANLTAFHGHNKAVMANARRDRDRFKRLFGRGHLGKQHDTRDAEIKENFANIGKSVRAAKRAASAVSSLSKSLDDTGLLSSPSVVESATTSGDVATDTSTADEEWSGAAGRSSKISFGGSASNSGRSSLSKEEREELNKIRSAVQKDKRKYEKNDRDSIWSILSKRYMNSLHRILDAK